MYEEWKKKVDAELEKICGMDSDDIPDWDYIEAYNNKMSPKRAAKAAFVAAQDF